MIRRAKSKVPRELRDLVDFRRASLAKPLPYPDSTFDYIINVSVLHLLPDPVFTLRELERVLKSNGRIIIVHYPNPKTRLCGDEHQSRCTDISSTKPLLGGIKRFFEDHGFTKYWTSSELCEIIGRTNLEIVSIYEGYPLIVVARKL
jgi:ubiquinone/menaquinone biosynthesis C-methylase UbiE